VRPRNHARTMTREPAAPEQAPGSADDARTKEALRVIEEYASALREILRKLRRL